MNATERAEKILREYACGYVNELTFRQKQFVSEIAAELEAYAAERVEEESDLRMDWNYVIEELEAKVKSLEADCAERVRTAVEEESRKMQEISELRIKQAVEEVRQNLETQAGLNCDTHCTEEVEKAERKQFALMSDACEAHKKQTRAEAYEDAAKIADKHARCECKCWLDPQGYPDNCESYIPDEIRALAKETK